MLRRKAAALRREALARIYLRGYPRQVVNAKPRVVWGETLKPHRAYVIRKLRYEAVPDFWIPALLYVPTRLHGKTPVVLNPNGHHSGGKAVTYKQARCINLVKRGMIALNFEFLGMSELEANASHDLDCALLDLTGMAGVGLFYLAMRKGLDVLLAHNHADASRVCMTGLSGGGWQTIVLSALDKRITVIVPVAGYTSVRARVGCTREVGDFEQNPVDLTTVLDYQDMTSMLAPRPTLQLLNEKDDCCFKTSSVKPVIYDAVRPTFRAFGAGDNFKVHSNKDPGTHNYGADHRSQLYKFLNEHFELDMPVEDLPYEEEVHTERELTIGLPPEQRTMREMAYARARVLAAHHRTPRTKAQRASLRRQLVDVLRLPRYVRPTGRLVRGTRTCGTWLVTVGPWRVPVSGMVRGQTGDVELAVADVSGRAQWAGSDLSPRNSVRARFVVDPLGSGENCQSDKGGNSRHLMLVDACGQRLLGVRVAQTLAVAEFVSKQTGTRRLTISADGVVASLTALLAAAIKPGRFHTAQMHRHCTTLCRLFEWPLPYEWIQSCMCFGLLEVADVPQILALMQGVTLSQPARRVSDDPC
jgi:hypothetical protein